MKTTELDYTMLFHFLEFYSNFYDSSFTEFKREKLACILNLPECAREPAAQAIAENELQNNKKFFQDSLKQITNLHSDLTQMLSKMNELNSVPSKQVIISKGKAKTVVSNVAKPISPPLSGGEKYLIDNNKATLNQVLASRKKQISKPPLKPEVKPVQTTQVSVPKDHWGWHDGDKWQDSLDKILNLIKDGGGKTFSKPDLKAISKDNRVWYGIYQAERTKKIMSKDINKVKHYYVNNA